MILLATIVTIIFAVIVYWGIRKDSAVVGCLLMNIWGIGCLIGIITIFCWQMALAPYSAQFDKAMQIHPAVTVGVFLLIVSSILAMLVYRDLSRCRRRGTVA